MTSVSRLALVTLLFALGALSHPPPARGDGATEPLVDVFLFLADWRDAEGGLVPYDDLLRVPSVLVHPVATPEEAAPPATAAEREPPEDVRALLSTEPERWPRFSTHERERAVAGARIWTSLSETDRRRWRVRFTRWYADSPEQRTALRARVAWWNALPPARRLEIAAIAQMPTPVPQHELDPVLREVLRDLPREERKALQSKLRAMTPEEQRRYAREELGL